ncbi:SPFH domain-containing protein [Streptomyces cyaneofuscatus]|uniref:SPFH domain-containing protein n=1 Tax=Streptomyces cyaneofuscatus TaxID=66883 RepID=UPI0036DAEB3A
MSPDQNPHALTDHDGRTSGGETPMPLVDDVALHRPALPTPPPLFRPKEETPPAGDPLPGEDSLGVAGPLPREDSLGVGGRLPGEDPLGVGDRLVGEDPLGVGGRLAGEGPSAVNGPLSVEDRLPGESRRPVEDWPVGEGPSAGKGPRPWEDPLPWEASPEGPDDLAAPDSAPTPAPAPAPGSASDSDWALDPGSASDSDSALDPGSALDPASAPRPPRKPIRLVHPGRSLHLDQFKPAVPESPENLARPEPGLPPFQPAQQQSPENRAHPEPAPAPFQPAVPESPENLARPEPGLPPFQPVRRLRTEPSAEWTPLPAYGEEAGPRPTPAPDAQTDKGKETAPGLGANGATAPALDLVLDLANGPRATSATVSVSVPAPHPPPHPRRHSVIAGESTASIPVHLLFRDDPEHPEPAALPTTVTRPTTGPTTPADRTPRPRSPHPRVEPPTRPAPLADPRLVERPGPALPGYAALLTGAAGLLGVLALLWWRGALPAAAQSAVGLAPRPYEGIGAGVWAGLALLVTVVVLALGGLGRGRVGCAWVLTLFGDYRGSVRRTGLVWVSPLLLRRRVDVRLRHWRSEPLPAVDANGTALRVVVLVVWRIKDTVRAALGIEDHEAYLSAQVESAMARVLSQLPADAFHEDAPTLRNAEAVGDALTRMLKADCEPVGVEVYSAQPTGIEYAPEVAAAMQRRRIAAIDAKHRDSVLTSVVDAVDDTVNRLTTRGIVDLDDYERKALVKDLTVAFYTGRTGGGDSA